jgi:hypothetical protein
MAETVKVAAVEVELHLEVGMLAEQVDMEELFYVGLKKTLNKIWELLH